jgi:dTDP-4-dehydrorhamnose reductase
MTIREHILALGAGRLSENIGMYFSRVTVLDKENCDVTDRASVIKAIERHKPTVVINTAAITSPALCEQEHGLAWRVNVYGARNVAAACAASANVWSVHVSSNWAAEPVNEYAMTKLVSESVGFNLVVRACFYDEAYWVLGALGRGDTINLTESDEFNPISVLGFLKVLERFLERRTVGLVNVGTLDRVSHYDFGVMLGRSFGLSVDTIVPSPETSAPYNYPYHTYLEPHPYSRVSMEEDLRGFRDSAIWGVETSVESSEQLPSVRSQPDRDPRLR